MKKLLVILAAVALVAAFGLPAFADGFGFGQGFNYNINANDNCNHNCNFDAALSQSDSCAAAGSFACATAGYCGIPNVVKVCSDVNLTQVNCNDGGVTYQAAAGGNGGTGGTGEACFCGQGGTGGDGGNGSAACFDQTIKIEKASLTGLFGMSFANGCNATNQAGINSVAVANNVMNSGRY